MLTLGQLTNFIRVFLSEKQTLDVRTFNLTYNYKRSRLLQRCDKYARCAIIFRVLIGMASRSNRFNGEKLDVE